jgi:hypothetical protein
MASKPQIPDILIYTDFQAPHSRRPGDRNYGHIYARPLILGTSQFEPGTSLFSPDSYEVEPRPDHRYRALENLRASAQFDDDGPRTYGHEIEYDEHRPLTLYRAEQMIPWLRKFDKGMSAVRERFGYPQDFADFLAHFAAVLVPKVARPFWRSLTAEERNIEGTGYRAMDTEALRCWLRSEMTEYRKNAGLPVAAEN